MFFFFFNIFWQHSNTSCFFVCQICQEPKLLWTRASKLSIIIALISYLPQELFRIVWFCVLKFLFDWCFKFIVWQLFLLFLHFGQRVYNLSMFQTLKLLLWFNCVVSVVMVLWNLDCNIFLPLGNCFTAWVGFFLYFHSYPWNSRSDNIISDWWSLFATMYIAKKPF